MTSEPFDRRSAIASSASGSFDAKINASAIRTSSGETRGEMSKSCATSPIGASSHEVYAARPAASAQLRTKIGANASDWRNSILPSRTSSKLAEKVEARAVRRCLSSAQ